MNSVAYFTSRISSSSRSITLCSTSSRTTTSTSSRRKSTSSPSASNFRCLSSTTTTTNNSNNVVVNNGSNPDSSSSTMFQSVFVGLTAAGVATAIGTSTATSNDKDTSSQNSLSLSQCESDSMNTTTNIATTTGTNQSSLYSTMEENLKLFFYQNKETITIPFFGQSGDDDRGVGIGLRFEPTTTGPSSSLPIPGRVIDAVKASVDTASEWEKKAKETVLMIRRQQYPQIYDVSVRALKGDRLAMEDKYAIHDNGRFSAVFDGHGGGCVSKYLSETLYDKIKHNLKQSEKKEQNSLECLIQAIRSSFQEVEEEILNYNEYQYQGSTAVAVWVHEEEENGRTIVSANVGDSRAVLSKKGKAVNLTKDHKPEDVGEKKRITDMGGRIEWDPYCNVYRVCNLSLSRAIGDRFAKPAVSSEVDIKLHPINDSDNDDFVVLASDGLWDVMSSQDCVNYVNERLHPSKEQMKSMSSVEAQRLKFSKRKNMSRFVANEALRRGSSDNVCVIIVWLNKLE